MDKRMNKFEEKVIELLTRVADAMPGKVMPTTTADGRFTDNGDGTVSDKKTGLMWAKESSEKNMVFSEAEQYCKNFNEGNHKDWRLPTVEELLSLVDYTKYDPAINPIFKCASNWHWTSTPYAESSGHQWVVYFGNGRAVWDGRSNFSSVRPVRQY